MPASGATHAAGNSSIVSACGRTVKSARRFGRGLVGSEELKRPSRFNELAPREYDAILTAVAVDPTGNPTRT